jgi:hypothetical protein
VGENVDDSLNSIEIRHRDAILSAGFDPAAFLFESQLASWQQRGWYRDDEAQRFLRTLSTWSPSRFELIELLPLYYFADKNIRMMQAHVS